MNSVKNIYTTKEVADRLELNSNYLLRVAKELLENGTITGDEMRKSSKITYLFNDLAVKKIKEKLNR